MIDGKQAWIVVTLSIFLYGCGRPRTVDVLFLSALANYERTDEVSIEFSDERSECPNIKIEYTLWQALSDKGRDRLINCEIENCVLSDINISLECYVEAKK